VSARSTTPVVGFNHNVKHGQRVYHVQTEDSGLPHAHFITHLFLGGNVVATQKSSYAGRAGEADLAKLVRGMMEEQHKGMLRRLVAGEFRDTAERLSAPHYEPGVLATGQTGPAAVNIARTARAAGEAFAAKPAASKQPAARAAAPVMAPAAAQTRPAAAARPAAAKPVAPKAPQPWEPAPPGASNPASRRMPGAPLPQTTRVAPAASRSSVSPPKLTPSGPVRPVPARAPGPNLFAGGAKAVEAPHEDLPTLFAEELISEKSLDEVILAFLSADLEPQK
jgi:hypothetical protein